MKNENKKIREPYEPKDTPKPPQVIEPNSRRQKENPVEGRGDKESRSQKESAAGKEEGKPHLLADESDIEDETTI